MVVLPVVSPVVDSVEEIPELFLPPSRIFSYPTALGDTLRPAIERIFLPKEYLPALKVKVESKSGHTGPRSGVTLKRKLYRAFHHLTRGAQTLDFSGKFLFDSRLELDTNVGHVLENVVVPVLFAQKLLSERLEREVVIHVILRRGALQLAQEIYELLGIPIICTDDDVRGEIVTISVSHPTLKDPQGEPGFFPLYQNPDHLRIDPKFYRLHAKLFNEINFPGYEPVVADKIFIPRKGSRCLTNNDEVAQFLEQQGFKTYYFEDLTCAQKWSITRNAKVVVAVHGAALAHLVFNRQGLQNPDQPGSGVKVVELYSPGWSSNWAHRRQVNGINGKWCGVRGQVTPNMLKAIDMSKLPPNSVKSPYKDSFRVDCKSIQMALDYLAV